MSVRKIFSKVDPTVLVASVIDLVDDSKRIDASSAEEILQVCKVSIPADTAVKSHKHVPVERSTTGTQETWIVISGEISAEVFDIDDQKLDDVALGPGSCLTLFRGGHNLKSLSNAVFYEVKNGPYYGPESDRVAITNS